jgi:5S rRNA maturation endonuclease (ribonuclease M5)
MDRLEPIIKYLEENNIEYKVNSNRTYIRLRCLNPNHVDTVPSMYIYDNGQYHCFGCNIHGKVRDLFKLKYTSFSKIPEPMAPRNKDLLIKDLELKEVSPPEGLKDIDFPIRGISPTTFKQFGIKLTRTGNIYFPILIKNKLVGYAIRYPHSWIFSKEKTINNKHFSQYLYPFHVNSKTIILVEGLFDMVKLWDCGLPAMCTFGTYWPKTKSLTLIRNCPQRIILMFDNDSAGQKIQTELENKFKYQFEIVSLKIDKDPDEWIDVPRNLRKLIKIFHGGVK